MDLREYRERQALAAMRRDYTLMRRAFWELKLSQERSERRGPERPWASVAPRINNA